MQQRLAITLSIVLSIGGTLRGQDRLPIDQRFRDAKVTETPDFQQHIVPLLGRLGCNGRSCHGSFQGRGGFRLSLFGYDFKMDHDALLARSASGEGKRVDVDSVDGSLIIAKPTLQVDHEGGDRYEQDSWEHRVIQRWIAGGAKGTTAPRELDRIEIEPSEVVFTKDESPVRLRVVAIWQDGRREDVTPLCRFRTNDDSIATVDQEGRLDSIGRGDTHIVAFYDNGVAAVPVMRAVTDKVENQYPVQTIATEIDGFIQAKLRKLGVVPSPVCSDSEFLRRLSIDLTGTLPTPLEVEAFIADKRDDKRGRKIDELLQRPAYAAWWANKLCDITGCNPSQQAELGQETSVQWYLWIYSRLRDNVPYDELVEGIVLATSRVEGQTYDEYATETTTYYRTDSTSPTDSTASFSDRGTMPHFWTRRTMAKPEDKGLAFAHSFLGIKLQCAQCHKHPFAPWTQNDFKQFSEFFETVKFGVVPAADKRYRELAKQVGLNVRGKDGSPVRNDVLRRGQTRVVPWRELYIDSRQDDAKLSLLRSGIIELDAAMDPRREIMQWMLERDNPWFARSFVNRVWAGYFQTGIVDPPDDLSPANPPSHPALLDWLANGFIENDYDMKWLHREIASSHAYQRSWQPNDSNRLDTRNFSRAIPRRIPAEVVYDALKQVVAGTAEQDEVRTDLSRRAIGHLSMRMAGTYAMQVFGKPDRAINCDCERVNRPTLLQSIFLQNDPLVEQRLENSGWLEELASAEGAKKPLDAAKLVRESWLRALGREPAAREQKRAVAHLSEADSITEGVRDLLWALINTKEFVLNH
jgi:hypothetical protein